LELSTTRGAIAIDERGLCAVAVVGRGEENLPLTTNVPQRAE
jgi:hypothetical protein